MEALTDEAVAARPRKSVRRQVLQGGLSLALVVAIFFFVLPKIASFSEVWASIRAMTWGEIAVLAVVAGWNVATYSFVWTAALPGLTYTQAGVASNASTAIANSVPGGSYPAIGLTYSMFHSWGFRRSVVTLALVATGIFNNLTKLALPVVALTFLALGGQATPGRVTMALVGIAALAVTLTVFTLALRSDHSAAWLGNRVARLTTPFTHLARRPPAKGWDLAMTRFRAKTIDLLRARWHWLTLATVVSHLSLFLVLLIALRQVGVSQSEVSWAEALAAFSFTRIITAIPLTPGGLGVVELAMTGGLVAAGGDRPSVVAAVLVYRLLTFLPPIPIGVLAYVFWRRNRSWRRAALPSPLDVAVSAA